MLLVPITHSTMHLSLCVDLVQAAAITTINSKNASALKITSGMEISAWLAITLAIGTIKH